ncbi:hypothetical protein DEO72_LG5g2683 [Vigna unguiculata]|uniref:Uncharacterized protein n=1 Tax=Vigna unguiculata TaxID=3917 RepID=A0A4D6M1W6_VIGUN|nr:hypothetical protein DEO72_LG5g2683 [Vigna unguiculata]
MMGRVVDLFVCSYFKFEPKYNVRGKMFAKKGISRTKQGTKTLIIDPTNCSGST